MSKPRKPSRPAYVADQRPLELVVEGVGDVVKKHYGPALQTVTKESKRKINVTFVDQSDFWRANASLARKMQETIDMLCSWGASYIDKSDALDYERYKALRADLVIVATPDFTHVDIAEEWLGRVVRPAHIFIEKPLATSLTAARRLLTKVDLHDDSVLAFDHYRARLLPSPTQMRVLLPFLGNGVRQFAFYFLEDHSGSDPSYSDAKEVGRDGAIENEQRVKTLNEGVVLDGMPHAIAILAHFARAATFQTRCVKAGQYTGVDGDPTKRTEIDRETFAEVEFACEDYNDKVMSGKVYIGKGVRGVRALGVTYDHNVKLLEIEGVNGNTARFDLRGSGNGSSMAYLMNSHGNVELMFPLNPMPYQVFLQKVCDGGHLDDPRPALHVEVGKRILEILEEIRSCIPDKAKMRTYESGIKGVRQSLYLEDISGGWDNLFGRRCT